MKDTFGLSERTIRKICSILQNYPEIEQAIIYGSRAKGNYKIGSDIDLTISGNRDLTFDMQLKIMRDLDDLLLPYTIDLSILQMIENTSLLRHIADVGRIFYQKMDFSAKAS